MGSKNKVLPFIHEVTKNLNFNSCLDAFSGSGIVSYYFKRMNKEVYSNDFMHFPYQYNLATIENDQHILNSNHLKMLLSPYSLNNNFIANTFEGLYFTDEENVFLDNVRGNIEFLPNRYLRAIALSSLVRACLKKRPRGIFTYVGHRYNDGRKDLKKSLRDHFIENVSFFNKAVFQSDKTNRAFNRNIFDLELNPELVYLDPPYFSKKSDNDYTRRYHFVEGLVRNWEGIQIQEETKTKKFKKYKTPFDSKSTVYNAFDDLFLKFKNSILVISYSSNSLPNKEEMIALLKNHKDKVEVFDMDYMYSFGNQSKNVNDNANRVKEYLFVAS